MNTEEIRSVGIDIGTTTTSMVLSLLRIENVAKGFGVPSVRIVDKRILFRSDVMFTPFSTDGAIDGERIEAFLFFILEKYAISPKTLPSERVAINRPLSSKVSTVPLSM